jgi:6-pyruvoyl-tetrahydropterin synthase
MSPDLSEERNRQVYGTDYAPEGLGHNLCIRATFKGAVDLESGLLHAPEALHGLVRSCALQLDHAILNELPLFCAMPPTLEVVARVLFRELARRDRRLWRVQVSEGSKTAADAFATVTYLTATLETLRVTMVGVVDDRTGVVIERSLWEKVIPALAHEFGEATDPHAPSLAQALHGILPSLAVISLENRPFQRVLWVSDPLHLQVC